MKTTNLAGKWHYNSEDNPEFARIDFNDSAWPIMHIPQNWFLNGLDHHGVVWFRHEFEFQQTDEHAYQTLHFEGVDYFADVYLNGVHLGHHSGYFDPFKFDATRILKPGKNCLAIRVDSPYETVGLDGWYLHKRLIKGVLNHHDCRPGGGWEAVGQSYNTGGIWNRVVLKEHGSLTIEQMLLRAELDIQPPILNIDLLISNREKKHRAQLKVRCMPDNYKGESYLADFLLDIPQGESRHPVIISTPEAARWNPWDRGEPNLYQISVSLAEAHATSLFGFRTVQVDNGFHWYINGQPYFPRGSNYIASQWLAETLFPKTANSKNRPFLGREERDWFKHDVSLAKQANLNILRVHAHILPPEFHDACDRAGMLVWQDFPLQWGYTDELEFHVEAERQLQAMVTILYNHPSIAAWCCHNESPSDAPWMAGQVGGLYDPSHNHELDARLEAAIHKLDTSRYVHRNSGTGDGHVYPGWYFSHWSSYQNLPGAPFITEYGAQGLPIKESLLRTFPQFGSDAGHSELVRFKAWIESRKKMSASIRLFIRFGTAIWNWTEKTSALKPLQERFQSWAMKWGMKMERSLYKRIPTIQETPEELHHARQVWEKWRFHDFQPPETFDNGIQLGNSLDEFIANSQAYQSHLIQYGTECYRRAKGKITGLFQFDFSDPWPAITWSVVDYWRVPKPAYHALRRAMQPVLPSFFMPNQLKVRKAFRTSFCIVNDYLLSFQCANCSWELKSKNGIIASGEWKMDVPSNAVSEIKVANFPALKQGAYLLTVTVTSADGKPLGENEYDFLVTD